MKRKPWVAILFAFIAAVFYALNMPFSKMLLIRVPSTMMAALLYLGAGIGMGILFLVHGRKEPADLLTRKDLPYTIGMVLLDIAAPILLMTGLKTAAAANASLLNNFEIVATTLMAWILFHENISVRLWIGIVFITVSSMLLAVSDLSAFTFSSGSILILGATLCWGLENNCTRAISNRNTYEIVMIKGLFSGSGSLLIARILNESAPAALPILYALLLGFIAYGMSIFSISARKKHWERRRPALITRRLRL